MIATVEINALDIEQLKIYKDNKEIKSILESMNGPMNLKHSAMITLTLLIINGIIAVLSSINIV